MIDKHRQFIRDFKIEAVRLATKGDLSILQVVLDLDIHPNVPSRWNRLFEED